MLVNLLFHVIGLVYLYSQSFFRCHEWDATALAVSDWWLLGDAFEMEVVVLIATWQYVGSGAVFGLSRGGWRNKYLILNLIGLAIILSILTLAPPNPLSCLIRINCGSSSILQRDFGFTPWFKIDDYSSPIGHNVMPLYFRLGLWAICLCNMIVTWTIEQKILRGRIGRYIVDWWKSNQEKKKDITTMYEHPDNKKVIKFQL